MRRPRQLSDIFVKKVGTAGIYTDGRIGRGLALRVRVGKKKWVAKSWIQRVKLGGKWTWRGLGSYPTVSLAEARMLARETISDNSTDIPTFAAATNAVIAIRAAGWKNGTKSTKQWKASLRAYVFPQIGTKPIDRITSADCLAVLTPIWHTKSETARRLKQRMSKVFMWSIAKGFRTDDPTVAATAALPKPKKTVNHMRAIHHTKVGDAISLIHFTDAWIGTKLALEFLIYTAVRSGEVRFATWDEVNLKKATWTIPAERTKTNTEHVVPFIPGGPYRFG